ncbi:MAG TPA: type II secretion system F family protein [Gemmatimonadales bacterium]|jgi:general secretion pathway protein F
MPAFAYRAVDYSGKRVRGAEEAPSPGALTHALEARGLVVVEVAAADTDPGRKPGAPWVHLGRGQAVLEVTRAVATLLQAGLPLPRALSAAAHVATPDTRQVIEAVRERVARGESLAAALAAHSALFPPIYVGLVRAGERSGDLAGAFARLAEQLDREARLRSRLVSLALYPLILTAAGAVALAVLAFFVLPRFADLLHSTGTVLPRSTAFVLGVATALRRGWPLLVPFVIALPLVVVWSRQTDEGRRAASRMLLHLPAIGGLRRQVLSARLARVLGVLVGGGAPLLSALEESKACLSDPLVQDEVARVHDQVREGVPVHRAIAAGGFFHPLLAQLVAVGEESGRLQEFFVKAAEIFEERTERGAQRLVTLLEPAMIVTLGLVVAFVALSVLQAIYGVNAGVLR